MLLFAAPLFCRSDVSTENTFTGTNEMEFFDAQATLWVDNIIPDTACSDFVTSDDGDDIDPSTFAAGTNGVPAECD